MAVSGNLACVANAFAGLRVIGLASVATAASFSGNGSALTNLNVANLGAGSVNNTELGFLDGVTSGIQPQLNTLTTNLGTTNTNVANLTTTVNGKVSKASDTMTGALTVQSTIAASGSVSGVGGSFRDAINIPLPAGVSLTSLLTFNGTLFNFPADQGPRRTADIQSGFGSTQFQFLSLRVGQAGGGNNDAGALTNEVMRLTGLGRVGIGITEPTERLHVVGNILATGTITPSSDRNVKKNFEPVDAGEVLARVAALPLARWTYQAEADGIRHLGPMAQDFAAAFGLGANDVTIATVDADGVALAAIQGLNAKLERENAALRKRIERLEALLAE